MIDTGLKKALQEARQELNFDYSGDPREKEVYYRIVPYIGEVKVVVRIDNVDLIEFRVQKGVYNSNKYYSTEDLSNENIFFYEEKARKVADLLNKKYK